MELGLVKKTYAKLKYQYLRALYFTSTKKSTEIQLKKAYSLVENTKINIENQIIEDYLYQAGDDGVILSLIVPAYNEEKNIRKCLGGLLGQKTKYKYEVIILDNASIDATPDILKSYGESNQIRIITIKQNRGGSVARNIGIKNAKGKYIGFIDADDKISDNYVELLVDEALRTDADIVKCAFRYDYSGTYKTKIVNEYQHYTDGLGIQIMKYDGYIWDAIYRRELWDRIRFPEECWYEDIIIKMILLRECKRFSYLPDTLYDYYVNPNSTSKKQQKNASTKSLEQLWLAMYYAKYSNEIMNIIPDQALFVELLHEMGDMLYTRINKVEPKLREAAFSIAAAFIREYKAVCQANCEILDIPDRLIYDAFSTNSFFHWEIACQMKKWFTIIKS